MDYGCPMNVDASLDVLIPKLIQERGDSVDAVYNPLDHFDASPSHFPDLASIDDASTSYGVICGLTPEELKRMLIVSIWHFRTLTDAPRDTDRL